MKVQRMSQLGRPNMSKVKLIYHVLKQDILHAVP